MSTTIPRALLDIRYSEAAREYLASLPLEHHMEATPQATQREITVESFALLRLRRPEVHYFNELLVQYPFGDSGEEGLVVPDNMIVLHDGPLQADGNYALEIQPARPFLVLEYVSKSSKRKDYEGSFHKYERELGVPYYLLFYPDTQDLSLFRLGANGYTSVKPNDAGRLAIPELDLEVALSDGWARYWYRGELLELPATLQRTIDKMAERLRVAEEKLRLLDEKLRQAQEQARQANEKTEQLRAQMRAAGIEPNL